MILFLFLVIQRPKMREKNPPRSAFAASIWACECLPPHHSLAGTLIFTIATCWPQPAQVVFPQVRHFVARHIPCSSSLKLDSDTPGGISQ